MASDEQQGRITALETQKRNKKRVNVFVDGEYAFSLTLDDAARLHKGQQLSETDIERLQDQDAIGRAADLAAHFLGYRPRSVQEVRQHLSGKDIPPMVVEQAIERLTTLGYLNDRAFAEFWVQDRSQFKPASLKALRYELRQKGIADDVVSDVLSQQDEQDAAYRAAWTQAQRMRGKSQRDMREKVTAFLARRGFSYSMTREAVRRVEEELADTTPAFFATERDDLSESAADDI
jgi:regulatory protein